MYGQLNILLEINKNSNFSPSGKLPLPLENDFENFFIDEIDNIMKGFQSYNNSEDIFLFQVSL